MAIEIIMPRLTHDMTHGVIVRWLKGDGDFINKGEPLFDVETDKAVSEVLSEDDGYLGGVLAQEGDKVPIGSIVAYLLSEGEPPPRVDKSEEIGSPASLPGQPGGPGIRSKANEGLAPEEKSDQGVLSLPKIIASPIAKRIAREHGIDLAQLTGSGPRGRIIERDIQAFLDRQEVPAQQSTDLPVYDVVPLSQIRQTIAARMSESARRAPHFILEVDVNMSECQRLRQFYNEPQTNRISYTTILIKVVWRALRMHPQMNVSYHGDSLHRYREINLGIAVATPDGLRVPVLKNIEAQNFNEIQAELDKIVENAKNGRIKTENLSGGTFTISNLGMYGIDRFQAIINPPEAAILAVGCIRNLPWVTPEGVFPQPIMNLRLSIDHRAIDGAVAAPFLVDVQKLLENPYNLL